VAGVSVAFVCIPQSLAYAALAGLSPTQGLHSTAAAPFAAAPLASSRYLQTGCVAMSSLLTGAALAGAGLAPGTPLFAGAASVLAAAVGALRLALAAANGGALLALLPHTVLDGFVCGACWLVFATQVPVIVGAAAPPGAHFLAAAAWLLARPAAWQPGCVACAAATVACLLGGRRLHLLFPGAVVATLLGCAAAAAGLPVGPTVGAVQAGLPVPIDPRSLPWHLLPALLPAAAAIAVAGVAEAAAIGARFAADDSEPWSCNRELLSQGAACLAAAAVGGFPVAGSLSRTSLARTAGAATQRAHAITGAAVLLFLPLGAQLLAALPRAVLGGLVAVAVLPLLRPSPRLLLTRRAPGAGWPLRDLALGWTTLVVTLAASPRLELGLEAGLLLAMALAALQALDAALAASLREAAASGRDVFVDAAY
jgi:SulP family sulfate permease